MVGTGHTALLDPAYFTLQPHRLPLGRVDIALRLWGHCE